MPGALASVGCAVTTPCMCVVLHKKLLKAVFVYSKVSFRMLEAEELFNIIPLKLPQFISLESLSNFLKVA